MLKYGLNFLKTPYVAHTLEVNEREFEIRINIFHL